MKVEMNANFRGCILTFVLTNQGSNSCLCPRPMTLFMFQVAVEIRMFSANKMLCVHHDADYDNVMSTVTRRLLGTKHLCQGQMFLVAS